MPTFSSRFVYSDSSWCSIVDYIIVGIISNAFDCFKQMCIKHLPTWCPELKYTKAHTTQSLLSTGCHSEREIYLETEKDIGCLQCCSGVCLGRMGANEMRVVTATWRARKGGI